MEEQKPQEGATSGTAVPDVDIAESVRRRCVELILNLQSRATCRKVKKIYQAAIDAILEDVQ